MYQKIERLLKEKDVSAYRVAKDTGIAQRSFSDWKAGVCKPSFDNLIILSKYFNVPLDYFLEER